ncbi:protein of unknown function [Succinivibrio dextrinosolvens]|uniref:DUF4417 domain-containing protein n=1 Tax=Succinivibrio dextrinosolvens TaxID=83771 RepID=UPI0008EBC2F4|nr:DUF4417 domain-containing protein [Succinivibrio dextrinosolvens]SFS31994.1 protein of unknown function [Succinivibrio dextrinosolvens]
MESLSEQKRNNESFLRNQFHSENRFGFPLVRKQDIDLRGIVLKPVSDIKPNDKSNNGNVGVHFFVDDYRFTKYFDHYEKYINLLKQYKFVLTPDFSLYADMPIWRQIESVGKNRWCGAYWQSKGIQVIPTISWSLYSSYEFCFKGVEKYGIVAIGMIGAKKSKLRFLRGYDRMLEELSPNKIICLGTPFHEMEGNIFSFDYCNSRKIGGKQ